MEITKTVRKKLIRAAIELEETGDYDDTWQEVNVNGVYYDINLFCLDGKGHATAYPVVPDPSNPKLRTTVTSQPIGLGAIEDIRKELR